MAAKHPDLVLGCEADVWWSREAQPPRQAWSDDTPVRLGEKPVPHVRPRAHGPWGASGTMPPGMSVKRCRSRSTPTTVQPNTRAAVA